MLEEVIAKNYLSFKEEMCLSFEATKDSEGEKTHYVKMPDGKKLLRMAVIYGANASGKSNVLMAIRFLRGFMFEKPESMDEPTGAIPFMFDTVTPTKPSEFQLRFYVEGVRYWYSLVINRKEVVEEKLSFYKSIQPTMLFHRTNKDGKTQIKIGDIETPLKANEIEQLQVVCLTNMSVFAARGSVNISVPEIDRAREWLRVGLKRTITPSTQLFRYAQEEMSHNDKLQPYLLDFLRHGDFNIVGFNQKKEAIDLPEDVLKLLQDANLPEDKKNEMLFHLNTDFVHQVGNSRGTEVYPLTERLQSLGTKRILGLETAIFSARQDSGLLSIDEVESSLHPDLVEYMLEDFLRKEGESQLLLTTHYEPLLDLVGDLLRKDFVWFVEKQQDGSSDLYPLTDFRGLNKVSSFARYYRNGRFGATPNIDTL